MSVRPPFERTPTQKRVATRQRKAAAIGYCVESSTGWYTRDQQMRGRRTQALQRQEREWQRIMLVEMSTDRRATLAEKAVLANVSPHLFGRLSNDIGFMEKHREACLKLLKASNGYAFLTIKERSEAGDPRFMHMRLLLTGELVQAREEEEAKAAARRMREYLNQGKPLPNPGGAVDAEYEDVGAEGEDAEEEGDEVAVPDGAPSEVPPGAPGERAGHGSDHAERVEPGAGVGGPGGGGDVPAPQGREAAEGHEQPIER